MTAPAFGEREEARAIIARRIHEILIVRVDRPDRVDSLLTDESHTRHAAGADNRSGGTGTGTGAGTIILVRTLKTTHTSTQTPGLYSLHVVVALLFSVLDPSFVLLRRRPSHSAPDAETTTVSLCDSSLFAAILGSQFYPPEISLYGK